jgi:hypothetical protein
VPRSVPRPASRPASRPAPPAPLFRIARCGEPPAARLTPPARGPYNARGAARTHRHRRAQCCAHITPLPALCFPSPSQGRGQGGEVQRRRPA